MQYSVRNRRRLRQTGEIGVPRTITARGVGVTEPRTETLQGTGVVEEVRAEGSGLLRPLVAPVKEIVSHAVIKQNWQR